LNVEQNQRLNEVFNTPARYRHVKSDKAAPLTDFYLLSIRLQSQFGCAHDFQEMKSSGLTSYSYFEGHPQQYRKGVLADFLASRVC